MQRGWPCRACIAGGAILGYSLVVGGEIGGTAGAKLRFFQEDELPLQDKVSLAANQIGLFAGPLVPLIALAAIVAGRRAMLLFALFWVPVLVLYVLLFPGGLYHYYYRYQHPVLPFLAAFAGGGAASLIAMAVQRDFVVKALVVLGLTVAVVAMYEQFEHWRDVYETASTASYENLEAMALDLNTIVKPNETLATHDIGAVGYFGDFHVLDLVGLVNQDVIPYHEHRDLREYIDHREAGLPADLRRLGPGLPASGRRQPSRAVRAGQAVHGRGCAVSDLPPLSHALPMSLRFSLPASAIKKEEPSTPAGR